MAIDWDKLEIERRIEQAGVPSPPRPLPPKLYMTDRFCLRCPHCDKQGSNSAAAGGNKRCFHCGECGFVECEWCSPAHEDRVAEPLAAKESDPLIEELKRDIRRYGSHEVVDGVRYCPWFDMKPCTCGFDKYDTELREAAPPAPTTREVACPWCRFPAKLSGTVSPEKVTCLRCKHEWDA
jgi:hypothetical protein